jgi:hypothetical protein
VSYPTQQNLVGQVYFVVTVIPLFLPNAWAR